MLRGTSPLLAMSTAKSNEINSNNASLSNKKHLKALN